MGRVAVIGTVASASFQSGMPSRCISGWASPGQETRSAFRLSKSSGGWTVPASCRFLKALLTSQPLRRGKGG